LDKIIRILLVEDDLEVGELLASHLKEYSYQVEMADDGVNAFEVFQKFNFDLVISDIKMPNGDGIQLLQKVKNLRPEIKFVFLTGHFEYDKDQLLEKGANVVLYKPVTLKKLVRTIQEVS